MDMAFMHTAPLSLASSPLSLASSPLSLASSPPVREVSISRGVNPGRQRIGLSQNRVTGVQKNLPWFACRVIRFDIHRAEFFGVQRGDSSYVLMCQGLRREVSSFGGDGPGAEELFEAKDGNVDRYPHDLSWDSYLGEITTSEKVEKPSQYVPPPSIPAEGAHLWQILIQFVERHSLLSDVFVQLLCAVHLYAADICIRDKLESLFYTLERALPGQLDNDKAQVLCSMLCPTVDVQNPVICFRGSDKCSEWLSALTQVQASISLHELYYENDMEDPDTRRIYAVWTFSFLEHVRANVSEVVGKSRESESNQMSGETMFLMENSGLVSRIRSTWYVLQEDDGTSFTKAKDSLYHLFQRTF